MASNQNLTLQDYINQNFQYLLAAFPQLNTSPGTVLSGLISSFSNIQYQLNAQLNSSIADSNILTATGQALDAIANDFGLFRKPATFGSGNVTLTLGSSATQTLTGSSGARFSTFNQDLSKVVTFTSTAAYTFAVGQSQTTVPAAADQAGSQGNVGVGTITVMLNALPGVATITNGAGFTGGADVETDASLRQRILLVLVPVNTLSKVISAVLAVPGIFMCNAVDNQDSAGGFTVVAGDQLGQLSPYLSSVTAAVTANKSLGSNPNIVTPKITTVDITANYAIQTGAVAGTVQAALTTAINNFFKNLQLGQVFMPFQLISALAGNQGQTYFVPGLFDFQPLSYSIAVPYVPSVTECVKLGTLTLNLVTN